jgi:hypothetical protein
MRAKSLRAHWQILRYRQCFPKPKTLDETAGIGDNSGIYSQKTIVSIFYGK